MQASIVAINQTFVLVHRRRKTRRWLTVTTRPRKELKADGTLAKLSHMARWRHHHQR